MPCSSVHSGLLAFAQSASPKPEGDAPVFEFVVALAIAVFFLGLVLWTGKTHRRRLHYVFVPLLLAGLAVAIRYAEMTGRWWNFPKLPLRIHLTLAYTATVTTILATLSGLLHIAGKFTRKMHTRLAWLAVLFILLATSTGVWIFLVGEPKV